MMKNPRSIDVAVTALEDLKGADIRVLDVRELTTITDTMIICTGSSSRHVKALAQAVADQMRECLGRSANLQGAEESEWVLVDLGETVVHVMQAQSRAFYQLEKLWDISDFSRSQHLASSRS